jgi:hypothetical protein
VLSLAQAIWWLRNRSVERVGQLQNPSSRWSNGL